MHEENTDVLIPKPFVVAPVLAECCATAAGVRWCPKTVCNAFGAITLFSSMPGQSFDATSMQLASNLTKTPCESGINLRLAEQLKTQANSLLLRGSFLHMQSGTSKVSFVTKLLLLNLESLQEHINQP